MPKTQAKPSNFNVPNALTTLRLLLVPVFGWLLLVDDGENHDYRMAASIVFAFASFTDYVDGALARRNNQVTTFGKVADPIADKALTGVALIGLSILGELPWWVTVVIIIREVAVTVIRFVVIHDGVIPASRGGKLKTVTQMLAIFLYLLPLTGILLPVAGLLEVVRAVVMGIALLLTIGTGIDYAFRAIQVHRGAELKREAFGDSQRP